MFINPFWSHVNPNLALVHELIKKGVDVVFFTTPKFKPFLSKLCEVSLYPDDESLFDWGIEKKVKNINVGIRKIVDYYNRNFDKPFVRLFSFAKDMIRQFAPTCIIYDYFDASWAKDAANACGVISIASSPTYAINRAMFLNKPSEFARYVWRIPIDSKLTNTDRGIIKLAEHISRRICYEKNLKKFDLFEIGNSDYLNLIYTSRDLQPYAEYFDDKFLFVGCQVFKVDPTPIDFISQLENHPIIYFSLGSTIRSADKDLMKVCVDGLKSMCSPVIMSIGPYVEPQEIAANIGRQFILREHVPQLDMLRYTDVFITHCGHNSVKEALLAGIPMVCIPIQTDQFINAKVICDNGAGIYLEREGLTGEMLCKAVKYVLKNHKSMKEKAQLMGESLRQSFEFECAVEKIMDLAKF